MAQPEKPTPPKATTAAKPIPQAVSKSQPAPAPAAKAQPSAAPAAKAQPTTAPQPVAAPKPAAKPAAGGNERARMISEAASFIAQKRGTAGNPLADWLAAEKQIDQQLGQRR